VRRSDWVGFDFHGLAAIGVSRAAPTAPLFGEVFAPFRADGLERFDLLISGRLEPWQGGARGETVEGTGFRYTPDGLCLRSPRVQVMRHGEGYRLNGTVELLEYALPLLDRLLVARGAAMIHAVTTAYRNHGLCLAAPSGTGKTDTLAKLARIEGFSFLSDDWGFLTRRGVMLGCPKPLFIRPHHRSAYPHLFARPGKPLVPTRLSMPVSRLTRVARPFVTRHPRLALLLRRWSPEYMMVLPREALPGVRLAATAPLAACLFVERSEDGGAPYELVRESPDAMAARLVRGYHTGLPPGFRAVLAALDASGLAPLDQTVAEKTAVVRAALDGKPAFRLCVPRSLPLDRASDPILEGVSRVLAAAGVTPLVAPAGLPPRAPRSGA
jgi:hypothetical protein